GSTGRPKGVMVQHRSVLNLRAALARTVYADSHGPLRVSLNAPLSFDASVQQLVQLTQGHSLYVVPEEARRDASALMACLRGLDVLDCSPAHLRLLVEAGLAEKTEGVPERILVGGDAVDTSLWATLAHHPRLRVFNVYGPTECTVDATSCEVRLSPSAPSLGRPLQNLQAYVLDAHLRPPPVGVPGELYLGGEGLARGYLDRPELTAERFLPDPFSSTPGTRMYRTGDKVRWRAHGELEFLGRIDFQVKVRGFRIDLGEIESTLRELPGLHEAVVLAREDVPGDKRLVAYVVPHEGQTLDAAHLRAALQQRLPEYMVPSAFVPLPSLPLNRSGKVDRAALPAPETAHTGPTEASVPPRDALERELVRIWEEVLGVRPVGVRHDFFALGGHSLLAARLVNRVHKALGRPLPLVTLFQNPTVEQLAAALRQPEDENRPHSTLARLQAGEGGVRPLFLVHGGGGSALTYTELARHLGPQRPVYGLSAPGLDGGEKLPASVEEMARHYLAQVRTVQPEGPYLLGGWSFGGLVALEMAQQLRAAGETVSLLALMDSHAPSSRPPSESDELSLLAAFGQTLGLPWRHLSLEPERLKRLGGRELLAYVLEQARRGPSGTPHLELEEAEHLFALFRHHVEAQRRYVPRPYAGPAVLFRAGTQPAGVTAEDLGWRSWLTGGLTVDELPGDHYLLLRPPYVTSLARALARHLHAADSREAA
ncbi:MAG TPA: alpha/beta fold hydrolase, partial [Myxococcaceae bacterium]|nr:alpha/beta fold hydrolase [Myxococcaceae bacterium]